MCELFKEQNSHLEGTNPASMITLEKKKKYTLRDAKGNTTIHINRDGGEKQMLFSES